MTCSNCGSSGELDCTKHVGHGGSVGPELELVSVITDPEIFGMGMAKHKCLCIGYASNVEFLIEGYP